VTEAMSSRQRSLETRHARTVCPTVPPEHAPGDAPLRAPELPSGVLRLAEVAPRAVRWLWPGRVPLGKLTVLDGDPGLGKSTVVLDLAARVSRGAPLPDDSLGDLRGAASVVLLCDEDGIADTVRPRLEAAGADLTRVVAVTAVPGPRGLRPPRLPFDSLAIIRIVNAHAARLLVVDPLMAYLDAAVTAYRDQTVRAALAPLTLLADRAGVAVVVVRHLTKTGAASSLYRGGGSIGIIAAARSGLLVALDPHDPTGQRRVLATTKGNLAQPAPALIYTLEASPTLPAPRVVWHRPAKLLLTQRAAGHDHLRAPAPFLGRGASRRVSVFGIRVVGLPSNDSTFTAREWSGRLDRPALSAHACPNRLPNGSSTACRFA